MTDFKIKWEDEDGSPRSLIDVERRFVQRGKKSWNWPPKKDSVTIEPTSYGSSAPLDETRREGAEEGIHWVVRDLKEDTGSNRGAAEEKNQGNHKGQEEMTQLVGFVFLPVNDEHDRLVDKMIADRQGEITHRLAERERRLRALGFEDVTNEERKKRLALNMALRDWPK